MSDDLRALDAEDKVLGALLQDDFKVENLGGLAADDFSATIRSATFEAILAMRRRGDVVDVTTVAHELKRLGLLDTLGGPVELTRLLERVPSAASIGAHVGIVVEYANRRRLVAYGQQIALEASDPQRSVETIRLEPPVSVRPKSPALIFLGVEELLETSPADPPFLVEDLIADSAVTLLIAKPKVGKSTLTFAILKKLEAGEPFAEKKTQQSTAVVLSEEARPTLAEKVRRFGLERTRFLTREQLSQGFEWHSVVAAAVADARQVGARLLVIDTLSAWARLGPDAEKDAGSMAEAMRPLLNASGAGLAVLVIHHARKADAKEGDAVRGSTAIFASVDTLLEMRRPDRGVTTGTARVIACSSRFGSVPPELCVDLRHNDFVAIADAKEASVAAARKRVLDALIAAAPASLKAGEVQQRAKMKKSTVGQVLKELHEEGAIGCDGKGIGRDPHRYSASPAPATCTVPGSPPTGEGNRGTDRVQGDSVPTQGNQAEPGTSEQSSEATPRGTKSPRDHLAVSARRTRRRVARAREVKPE